MLLAAVAAVGNDANADAATKAREHVEQGGFATALNVSCAGSNPIYTVQNGLVLQTRHRQQLLAWLWPS